MKEDLISFETAKLAKEKGFDWNCLFMVSPKYHGEKPLECTWDNWNETPHLISLPTQSLLQKWLREKHEIYINVEAFNSNESIMFFCNYYDFKNLTIEAVTYQKSYEEALEKGLQKVLKLI